MEDVLTTVTAMLDDLGYDTVTAMDSPTALRILSLPEPIDAMLMDIGLPGASNGLELAELAARAQPNLKIATMSGYNEAKQADGTMKSWHGPHLTKPFQRSDLVVVMATLFAGDGTMS